ncbi:MAG: DNA translocase FtsK [Porticoccaceae bacterium]
MAKAASKAGRVSAVGAPRLERRQLLLKEGALIGWLAICAYLIVALTTYSPEDPGWFDTGAGGPIANAAGPVGASLANVFFHLFGYLAYLFPLLLAVRALGVFRTRKHSVSSFDGVIFVLRIVGLVLVMVSATALAALHHGDSIGAAPFAVGGILGSAVASASENAFSYSGSILILLAILFFGVTVFTDLSWLAVIDGVGRWSLLALAWARKRLHSRALEPHAGILRKEPAIGSANVARDGVLRDSVRRDSAARDHRPELRVEVPAVIAAPTPRMARRPAQFQQPADNEPVIGSLPPLRLLDQPGKQDHNKGYSNESLQAMSRLLEDKLQDFGIAVTVVEVLPGPVITRFEIQPAPGIKASRITGLARDLARSLAVVSVRVVEVIPGKSVVGIEIPNAHREMVLLSEVLSSDVYQQAASPLTLALGHDISGEPIVADLARMPHLLVAGTTGSGKSVGINAMLLSLLFKATPEDVRLILVDPKMLELSVYDGIPHLLTPVITDMKHAASGLRWCVGEMERRYQSMASLGVRNLAGYNRKVEEAAAAGTPLLDPLWRPDDSGFRGDGGLQTAPELQELPYIVVVIDEFADMMMIVGKKVEQLIARIAQKARAAGIHLILATQRPSVDVITGLIKANVPTRIAFQVSSRIDSRTILDQGGAEQLLGHGDMLYLPTGSGVPVRVHGAFVDDHEVHKVVADWKKRGVPQYLDDITDERATGAIPVPGYGGGDDSEADAEDGEADPLYDEAVSFVLDTRRASASSVQRKLRIGYNRASRLIEAMENAGLVSPMNSNGSREVLGPNHAV